jgi:uncharacterized membrane protein
MAKATKKPAAKKAAPVASGDFLENANIVHALAYVPYLIGAVAMYFLGKSDKKAAMHHIKYSALIAFGVIILAFVLNGFFMKLVALGYLILSAYFAWKAYKGEDVHVEFLDTIEDKIAETVKK